MKKSDYFLPKTGKEFNFRAFEWNTSKENINHAWKNGLANARKGEHSSMSKLT